MPCLSAQSLTHTRWETSKAAAQGLVDRKIACLSHITPLLLVRSGHVGRVRRLQPVTGEVSLLTSLRMRLLVEKAMPGECAGIYESVPS